MGEPRLGTIDVGSNAIRLRIAELDANGAVRDVSSARASVRLGRDVFRSGHLSKTTLDQATRALASFREIMESAGVSSYRAVATSATREASNGADFVLRAEREAGIDLETIDGHEEARLVNVALAGAVRLAGRVALADVGGGSTEMTLLDGRRRLRSASLPLGTVRLLEAWNPEGGAVGRRKLGILAEVVDRALVDVASDLGRAERLVATGGTVTALAKLCGRDGHGVSVARLAHLLERLRRMSEAERVTTFGMRRDRRHHPPRRRDPDAHRFRYWRNDDRGARRGHPRWDPGRACHRAQQLAGDRRSAPQYRRHDGRVATPLAAPGLWPSKHDDA